MKITNLENLKELKVFRVFVSTGQKPVKRKDPATGLWREVEGLTKSWKNQSFSCSLGNELGFMNFSYWGDIEIKEGDILINWEGSLKNTVWKKTDPITFAITNVSKTFIDLKFFQLKKVAVVSVEKKPINETEKDGQWLENL